MGASHKAHRSGDFSAPELVVLDPNLANCLGNGVLMPVIPELFSFRL